jgi:hypothetical protein
MPRSGPRLHRRPPVPPPCRLQAQAPACARRRLLALPGLALAAALALGFGGAPAWGDSSQDRAAAERGRGRILALEQLVRQVSAVLPGRLLEAELEDDDGRLVYELQWLLPDGRRLEIELDARDGTWLSLQGPRLETAFRRAPAPAAAKPGEKR